MFSRNVTQITNLIRHCFCQNYLAIKKTLNRRSEYAALLNCLFEWAYNQKIVEHKKFSI